MEDLPQADIPTKAIVVEKPGAPFVLQDVTLDEVRPHEVLVQMRYTGLCHTDLVAQAGDIPIGAYPAVFGHEGAGVVRRIGTGVAETHPDLKPGDAVLLSFISCMSCTACRQDRKGSCAQMTQLNFGGARGLHDSPIHLSDGSFVRGQFFGQSSFSALAIVDIRSVVKYDGPVEDLSFLAPIGCGYQTGAGTILNVLRPTQDHSVAVFGLGAVGLCALMAAKSSNVQKLIAVDIVDAKLELATSLGATHTINPKLMNVNDAIRAISPEGVDYIIDATGLSSMLNDAVRALGHRGTLAVVGTPKPGEKLQINALDLLMSCKTVLGVIEGDSDPCQLISKLIDLYHKGQFPIDKLSKVYAVDQLNEAIDDMKQGKVVKPVLKWP